MQRLNLVPRETRLATRERARTGNSTICYRKKHIDVSLRYVCPVIDIIT